MHWLALRTNSSFVAATWTTSSVPGLVGCMLLTIVLGVTYEGLTYFIQLQEEKLERLREEKGGSECVSLYRHCALAVLNTFRTLDACILLLSINTLNLWVLTSVVVGTGIGYLLMRPTVLYFIRLVERNSPTQRDIEMQPLIEEPCAKVTEEGNENEILRKYFGSIKNHWDFLKHTKIYNVQSEENKKLSPPIHQLYFAKTHDVGTNDYQDCHILDDGQSNRALKDISLSRIDSEERWKFVRDTFKRISRTRLQLRRKRGLPARIEQMGGLNDTFELEMDTWVQNESDVFHERSNTLCNKPVTMYVTVV